MKLHKLTSESYSYVKFKVKPTERSKTTTDGKPEYEGIVILKGNGSVHGAYCPCLGGRVSKIIVFAASHRRCESVMLWPL